MGRCELIYKLVTTNHLNTEERIELGHLQVSRDEIVEVIREILTKTRYFPPDARPWEEGQPVYEGSILECLNGHYRVHQQTAGVHGDVLVGATSRDYCSLDRAIQSFIKTEFANDIDGIPIL